MTRQGESLGIENFSTRCSKDLKCYLNKFVKTFLNILVDRLHPVGGWQILWVEAVGGLVGWWLESEKGWKGLAAGSRVSTQASRDSTPFLSGGKGRMASGPPTHV